MSHELHDLSLEFSVLVGHDSNTEGAGTEPLILGTEGVHNPMESV